MARIFSGIQPTGDLHLGNLLGALNNWVRNQHEHDCVYCVVDLHALTAPQGDSGELEKNTIQITKLLLACGIDPEKCILFAQSSVPEHSEMAWLLQCTVSFGELSRMTQFKEKSGKADFIPAGLFTYPALQAADILLYNTEIVPVGDDQRQHIELTRDIAERFNSRYGETFVLPEHHITETAARVMDLQNPENKMSKSDKDASGTIWLLDDAKTIDKKVKRAVTDSGSDVEYDPEKKQGVSNLLEIMSALSAVENKNDKQSPKEMASQFNSYKDLKETCAEMIISAVQPIQQRFSEISDDDARDVLAKGKVAAHKIAHDVFERASANVGLASI